MTAVAVGSVIYRVRESSANAPVDMFGVQKDWARFASVGAHVGNPAAKITVTVFSDFQCPYCAKFATTAREMLDRYPNDVRMVFRHSPINSLHAHAEPAARAAICADAVGKFREFHDAIFKQQDSLGKKSWGAFAIDATISDSSALVRCMASEATSAVLSRDQEAAVAIKLSGTPLVLVDEVVIRRTPDRLQMDSLIRLRLPR